MVKFAKLFIIKTYTGFVNKPNTLIYGLNEFKVTYPKIILILFIINIFLIIQFQGLVAR